MTFPLLVSEKSTSILSHSGDILIEAVLRAFMKLSVSQLVEFPVNIAPGFADKQSLRTPPSIKINK